MGLILRVPFGAGLCVEVKACSVPEPFRSGPKEGNDGGRESRKLKSEQDLGGVQEGEQGVAGGKGECSEGFTECLFRVFKG